MSYGNSFQRWIYNNSPKSIQNYIVTYYGSREKSKRYGKQFNYFFEYLKKAQWFSKDELYEIQNKKLNKLISYSYENVPYYRRLFDKEKIRPTDIRKKSDLKKIPLLNKETVRRRWKELLSKKYSKKDVIISNTSGSSGKPLTIYASKNYYEREYAFRWMHFSWGKVIRNELFATFGGHPVVPVKIKKPPFWRFNKAENQIIFSSQHISPDTLKYYANALNTYKPVMIHAYPSAIYLIACYINNNRFACESPRAIFTCSETLLTYQRKEIEKAFKCKVYNWYGNTERVAHITECERGNMHIQPLHSVVEIINKNGENCVDGEEGEIVGTNIDNYIMPLIRYCVGDTCIPNRKKCACGRAYPIVDDIIGRIEDYVITPEGRYVGRLDHIFKNDVNVKEAQLIQETRDLLRIRIVTDDRFSAHDKNRINIELKNRLGYSMRYEYEYVDYIPRQNNNKFKFVINKINK